MINKVKTAMREHDVLNMSMHSKGAHDEKDTRMSVEVIEFYN